jgi:hypothetical protein
MRFPIVLGFTALFAAACGSNDPGTPNGPCGDNHACPNGYTCDLRTNICVMNGTGPDGGTSIDARTADAGGADAGNRPDSGSGGTIDAGNGGGPDGGSTVAPVTTITPEFDNSGPINDTTPTFDLSSSIVGSTIECKVDSGSFAVCDSPFTTITLGDGTHTLFARSTSPDNVHELSPPHLDFTIDTTAPTTTIDSPADNATIGANSTLIYSANEILKEFDCSFDGATTFVPCGSGMMGNTPIALADGPHTATVKGTDRAGNPSEPVTIHFTIDSAALTVNIDPHSVCANEPLTFTASKSSGVTFSCSFDGAVTDPCTSPFPNPPSSLSPGMHTFIVTARDELGNTGVNMVTFLIDITPLQVSFDAIFPGADAFGFFDSSGTIAFSVNNRPGITAVCFIDSDDPSECDPTLFDGSFDYGPLSDISNPHTFTVIATDACGGTAMDTHQFNVDTTPPVPCLIDANTTGGVDISNSGSCLDTPRSGGSGSITFAAEPGTYTCQVTTNEICNPGKLPGIAPPPFPPPGTFTCAPGQAINFGNLTDCDNDGRVFTLTVTGTDVHGNSSVTPLNWIVDTTRPSVTLGPPPGTSDSTNGTLTITYTVNPMGDRQEGVTFLQCLLDGHNCTCGQTSATCTDVPAGDHFFTIQPKDEFANTGFISTNQGGAPYVMTYSPNAGRAIFIGHDYFEDDANTTAILAAALVDVPGLKTKAWTRKPRVAWFNAGGDHVNSTEFGNVVDIWTPIIDTAASHEFTVAGQIATQIVDADILFVFDQGDPATATAIANAWNLPNASTFSPVEHFLNAGGTMIVLDGVNANNLFSETFRVYSDGRHPVYNFGTIQGQNGPGDDVAYDFSLAEQNGITADRSEIAPTDLYVAPNDSVFLELGNELGQPRIVYGDDFCGGGPEACPLIFEKIFPVYTLHMMSTSGAPGDPITLVFTPALTQGVDYDHIDCSFECNGEGNCPCQQSICPCDTDVDGHFLFPSQSNDYIMEFFVVDQNLRPGRIDSEFANVNTPTP